MLLADMGADVVKVEPPGGEPYRLFGQPITGESGATTNLNITRWSRGKRSVVLDLKSDEGRAALTQLVLQSDVLTDNFRPGVLPRLGFSVEHLKELNPRLIYASISGFGHDDLYESPYGGWPAYAILTEAMSGLMHLAGEKNQPPVWMGFAMSDIFAGVLALNGVLIALRDRDRTGRGRRVDIAMHDGALFMNDLAITACSLLGEVMERGGYSLQAPWSAYPAADGYVALAVLTQYEWDALCAVIGRPDLTQDERLATGRGRAVLERDLLFPAIGAWTGSRRKQQAAEELIAAGVPAAPVRTAEDIMDCSQVAARGMLVVAEDPVVGAVRVVGNPIKVEGFTTPRALRIPALGEHTAEVLAALDRDPLAGSIVAAGEIEHSHRRYDGPGPTITLVHGGLVGTPSFRYQLPSEHGPGLTAAAQVLAYDQRGYGASTRGMRCDIATFADDLLRLWDVLEIERSWILGFSLGGLVAVEAALRAPRRVAGLLLASAGVLTDTSRQLFVDRAAEIEGGGFTKQVIAHVTKAFSAPFAESHPDEMAWYSDLAVQADPAGVAGSFRSLAAWRLPQDARLDLPILIVNGGQDVVFGPEAGRALQIVIGAEQQVVFQSAGHTLHYESPDAFNRIIGEFVGRDRKAN